MTQPARTSGPDLDASGAMMRLITGAWAARMVHTAAELCIADHLAEGPRDAGSLAAATASHAPSLARLLRALAAIGVLREDEDRRYALTPLGATLRSGVPGSMRPWVLLCFADDQGKAWEALTHAVKTGEHAYRHIFGVDKWTRLAQHPEAARLFDAAMQSLTEGANGAIIANYPFGQYRWIVDVGGGNGALLMPVLARHPGMRATLFDLPHVADAARARIAEAGLSDRYESVGGDAFAAVPAGADAYVLKGVIHDWEDAEALAILRTVRAAMGDGARLLVIERILPERIDPSDILTPGRFIHDINMMLNPGGRERTEAEFRDLLARAGLRLARIVPIPCPLSVIEADPA
ncbi:methyltransferase [Falsiroseomonas oryzae]|uniref:methyltransferase n=1 Tax=Falsiroseomonas oryzae TaxID=2766473 RepID=UPI0022EA4C7F|nr:methyltransferase [Roseomonas sp. MO-31]